MSWVKAILTRHDRKRYPIHPRALPDHPTPAIQSLLYTAIYVATSALGLLVASWILPDFRLAAAGFVTAVLVFAVAQSILGPFIFRMTNRYIPAAIGGFGLISTLVALFVAQLFPDGLSIRGVTTWVIGTLVVWLATTLGAWLLPLLFLKKRLAARDAQAAQKHHE